MRRYLYILLAITLTSCGAYRQPQIHSSYVPVQHGRIQYYQLGHGSPIVFISGYGTDVSSWNQSFLQALALNHRVIIFNNRNVGGSIIKSKTYEAEDLANDTAELIRNLHLKKPAVLGISMGGMIAQQVAVSHPDQVGQLILINTAIAGKQAIHPTHEVEERMKVIPRTKLHRYVSAVELFSMSNSPSKLEIAQSRIEMAYALAADRFLPSDYLETDPSTIMPLQSKLVTHWINNNKVAKKIPALKMPVLILNGEADLVIPPINSEILAKNIPHARLVRWKHGGHAIIYQYPSELAQTIDRFIKASKVQST